jgi:thiol-disulfide isomerase/thioredoxin
MNFMRTTYLVLSLFFVANVVFGQISAKGIAMEDEEFTNYFLNRDIPMVKGKIINLSKEEINKTKIEFSIVTPLHKIQVKKTCSLNTDGTFELKLDYPFPYQQIWIEVDSLFYTGVYANTDLFIELDAGILKTQNDAMFNAPGVKYLGQDGVLNEYTNNSVLFKREKQLEIDSKVQICLGGDGQDYDTFIKTYDSLFTILKEIDDEYIKQNPSEFSWVLNNERQSDYLAGLCLKHWGGKQMPPALFESVKAHKAYLTSNHGMLFYKYLFSYFGHIALNKTNAGKGPYGLDAIARQTAYILDSLFAPSKSDFFKIKFSSTDPKEQKLNMETILPSIKTVWCREVVNTEYQKTLKNLASINKILNQSKPFVSGNTLGQPIGELPFGAKLYNIDNIKADSLLSMLKSSFKNKALFIDFWATWCGPCISEFPYSKKLSDESKDLPIEFIYLCTSDGSDIEKWKSRIAEYKLSGHHFFVEKSIESALMNLFSFSGYPSYLFINTKGTYKADIPSRPSNLNRKKLLSLIKQ